jgi:hypothetical protein
MNIMGKLVARKGVSALDRRNWQKDFLPLQLRDVGITLEDRQEAHGQSVYRILTLAQTLYYLSCV